MARTRRTRLCEKCLTRPVRKRRGWPEPIDRLLDRSEEAPDGCWTYVGGRLRSDGYVELRDRGLRVVGHRLAYEHFIGDIPDGLVLDHLCRNRGCVNPWHLEPVTVRVNTLRGEGPTAQAASRTHCPKGHGYAGDNLGITTGGARRCRVCMREHNREFMRRRGGRKAYDEMRRLQREAAT